MFSQFCRPEVPRSCTALKSRVDKAVFPSGSPEEESVYLCFPASRGHSLFITALHRFVFLGFWTPSFTFKASKASQLLLILLTLTYRSDSSIFFFFLIHERHRESERQREQQAPCREPDVGLDPGTAKSCPEPKGRCPTAEPPRDPLKDAIKLYL